MREETLRAELEAVLRPIRETAPPPIPVLRRRLRRRRVRTAIGGTAAAAVSAVAVLAVWPMAAPHPPGTQVTATSTASAPAPAPGEHEAITSYTIPEPVSALTVTGHASAVTITASERSTVAVTEYRYYARTLPDTTHVVSAGTLSLNAVCADEQYCGVGYVIQVPRTVAVTVTILAGGIRLSGLSGPVTASTGTGGIMASGLTSSTVTLHVDTGGISAGFTAPPDRLVATTQTGAVNIGVPGDVSYRVTAQAISSVVNVTGSSTSRRTIIATATTGSVTVVPGNPATSPANAVGLPDASAIPPCFPFCSVQAP
jgi:hypothetical protein